MSLRLRSHRSHSPFVRRSPSLHFTLQGLVWMIYFYRTCRGVPRATAGYSIDACVGSQSSAFMLYFVDVLGTPLGVGVISVHAIMCVTVGIQLVWSELLCSLVSVLDCTSNSPFVWFAVPSQQSASSSLSQNVLSSLTPFVGWLLWQVLSLSSRFSDLHFLFSGFINATSCMADF